MGKKRESTLSTNGPEKLITSLCGRAPAPNLKIYGGEDNPECILSVAITGERRRRNPLRKNAGNNFHLPPKCGSKFSCLPLLLLPLSLVRDTCSPCTYRFGCDFNLLALSRARCNINAFAVTVRCYKSRDARARSNARGTCSLTKKEDGVKREVISNGIQFPIREMRSNRVHAPPVSGRQRKETKRRWNESVGRATVIRFIRGYRPGNVHDMM